MKPRYIYKGKLCPVCQIDFEQNIVLIKTEELKKEWVNFEKERIVEEWQTISALNAKMNRY